MTLMKHDLEMFSISGELSTNEESMAALGAYRERTEEKPHDRGYWGISLASWTEQGDSIELNIRIQDEDCDSHEFLTLYLDRDALKALALHTKNLIEFLEIEDAKNEKDKGDSE